MILMSEAVFKLAEPETLRELCLVIHAGEHVLKDKLLPPTMLFQVRLNCTGTSRALVQLLQQSIHQDNTQTCKST